MGMHVHVFCVWWVTYVMQLGNVWYVYDTLLSYIYIQPMLRYACGK